MRKIDGQDLNGELTGQGNDALPSSSAFSEEVTRLRREDLRERVSVAMEEEASVQLTNNLPALKAGQVIEISHGYSTTFWIVKNVFDPSSSQTGGAYHLKRLAQGDETLPGQSPEGPLNTIAEYFSITKYGTAIVSHKMLNEAVACRDGENKTTFIRIRVRVVDLPVSLSVQGPRSLVDEPRMPPVLKHAISTAPTTIAIEFQPLAEVQRIDEPRAPSVPRSSTDSNPTRPLMPLSTTDWAQEAATTRRDLLADRGRNLAILAVGAEDLPKQDENERLNVAHRELPKAFQALLNLLRVPRFTYEDAHRHIMVLITYQELLVAHNQELATLINRIDQLIALDQNTVVLTQMKESLEVLRKAPALPALVVNRTSVEPAAGSFRGAVQQLKKRLFS